CRASREARSSPTASWLLWPDAPARRVQPGRSARRTRCRSSSLATVWSPRRVLARTARAAWSTSGGCSRSRGMPLSDDLRNELAAIAPQRECDRLAELSALFHTAGALRIHGRGRVSVVLDVSGSAVARRAFTLLR